MSKKCPACNGAGGWGCTPFIRHYNAVTHSWVNTPCPNCGGTGHRTCRECNGKGEVPDA